jgi:tetratricopeptide (TPR) repeat protein
LGQPERARAPFTEVLATVAAAPADATAIIPAAEIAFAHDAMGIIELGSGNLHDAETHLRAAVALTTDALGEDSPLTTSHQTNLALALIAEHRLDAARLLLRRAQYVLEARNGRPTMQLALVCVEMSSVASGEGKMAEAEDYAQHAISILSTLPKADVRALASAQVMLAGIYLRNHDPASAEKILPGAVEIQRETGATPNSLGASIRLLGELRVQQRNWRDAEKLFRESLGIYGKAGTENVNSAVVPVLRDLADVLKHQGAPKDEVRALESQVRDILRATSAPAGKQPTPRA